MLVVPAVIALSSNQGTAESYRQAGLLNHQLFNQLQDTVDRWRDKEVLLLDTSAIRTRGTPGLLGPVSRDQMAWAQYHNALLLRGFTMRGMVQSILGVVDPAVTTLHDIENGVRFEGDMLIWHDRFQPESVNQTPASQAYVVYFGSDCSNQ